MTRLTRHTPQHAPGTRSRAWTLTIMKKIILILSLCIAVSGYGDTEKIDWKKILPENCWSLSYQPDLEDVFNVAEVCLIKYESYKAAEIYKLILENVPKKELEKFRYDGCSGTFIANAGMCFSASYAYGNIVPEMITNEIYYLCGKQAYEIAMKTPDGCQNLQRLEKLLWALTKIAPADNKKYMEHALEISDLRTVDRISIYVEYIWLSFIHGNTKEAATSFDEILKNNPRDYLFIHKKASLVAQELEDFHKAVDYLFSGFRLMRPRHFYGSPKGVTGQIKSILPLLTTEELEELIEVIKRIAARNPALIRNVRKIAKWMNLANDEQFQFELKLRELESSQSPEYKKMLRVVLEKYKNPEHAIKLGDYNCAAELYCKKIDKCSKNFRFRLRYYMKRFEHIIDKIDSGTLKKYRDVLEIKVKAYKPESDADNWYPELIEEMKLKIKEIDVEHPEWKAK